MDVWNKRDAFWRKFFRGKPMPIQEHPESILYNYLTTPRNNVPRWYARRAARSSSKPGWRAGSAARQGAYDEMVFRAKVRDNDKIYSPLGLESEGTAVDFQVGVNDYLYGTRFFSCLALTYGPGQGRPVAAPRRGQRRLLCDRSSSRVFGKPLDDAWDDWIAFEREFQKDNLAKLSAYPLTEVQHLSPRGPRLDVARLRRRQDQQPGRRLPLSRARSASSARMDLATGKLRKLPKSRA